MDCHALRRNDMLFNHHTQRLVLSKLDQALKPPHPPPNIESKTCQKTLMSTTVVILLIFLPIYKLNKAVYCCGVTAKEITQLSKCHLVHTWCEKPVWLQPY